LRDDQLFGAEKWSVELFYPAFRSRRSRSGLVPGGSATMTASTLLHATIRSHRRRLHIEKVAHDQVIAFGGNDQPAVVTRLSDQ